jgi:hypothetical protein
LSKNLSFFNVLLIFRVMESYLWCITNSSRLLCGDIQLDLLLLFLASSVSENSSRLVYKKWLTCEELDTCF